MISQLAKSVRETLSLASLKAIPKEEYYVNYKGNRLFFDFHLPTLDILVEVQGRQHYEFVEHFHGDAASWRAHQKRDRLKKEYASNEEQTLVTIDYNEIPITTTDLLVRIDTAQNG